MNRTRAAVLALLLPALAGAGDPPAGPPAPEALAAVDGPEALWRLLGAEEGWPAAEALRPGAPLAEVLAGLRLGEGLAWRRLTCQSGETVFGRAALRAATAPATREEARTAALAWEALAVRGEGGPAPLLLQALFAPEGAGWRLVALGARGPAGASGPAAPAFRSGPRLEALRLSLAGAGPRP